MSALLYAATNLLLRDRQWEHRPVIDQPTPTVPTDFSIATAYPAQPPPPIMSGAVYDAFPAAVASVTDTLASALATGNAAQQQQSSTSASSTTTGNGDNGAQGECQLLGSFALFVQLALGGLALMSLVYKRSRERPQRPIKIWFFDASKQVFGSVLVHMANVFMSMLTSGRFSVTVEPAAASAGAVALARRVAIGVGGNGDFTPNPCSFYLLNLAIDVSNPAEEGARV